MDFQKKIGLIRNIDSYDARFVVKVWEAYKKRQEEYENKKSVTDIVLKYDKNILNYDKEIIDLDKIWAKPYFYTKMRIKHNEIINLIEKTSLEQIKKEKNKFVKRILFNNAKMDFVKGEEEVDIVEFLKKINPEKEYILIAENLNEEAIFKEEQIKNVIKIKKIKDLKKQYELIYDIIYKFLYKDFVVHHYCDFKNSRCIAQQKHCFYPFSRKNGCCFRNITRCPHLENGKCMAECMACSMFACKFLGRRGISYSARDFVLLNVFFNKKQRLHLVFDFFKPKKVVLEKIYNDREII